MEAFDWQRIWWGEEAPPFFLLEIVFRSIFMYLLILGALRLTGKRGVKQLSLFELTIILGLGSAAGDAMFYHDVPLLHAVVVFGVVTLLYLLFNNLTENSWKVEKLLEGRAACIVQDGVIDYKVFKAENLTYDELFGELRQQQVEHLGQIRKVYLEATGELSVFFKPDAEVKPGLPIFPEIFSKPVAVLNKTGLHACSTCGETKMLEPGKHTCPHCGHKIWLEACHTLRLT